MLRRNWTLDATARAYVIGPWYEAEEAIVYRLPNYGIRPDVDPQYLTGGDIFLGMTYLH